MYAEERQQALASMVLRDRRIVVSDAAEHFGVTTETVRRDLATLERLNLVRRVHGGAVPADVLTTVELDVPQRRRAAEAEKARIGKAALDLLPGPEGSILLDAGTTTAQLAAAIPADSRLTVITNDGAVVERLNEHRGLELYQLGGRVRPTTRAAVGPRTLTVLSDLRVDVAFLGTNGLSLEHGLSTPDPDEAAVKTAMIAAARRVVVLADSSKLGRESLIRFGRLDQVDVVVTDAGAPPDVVAALEARDIDVVVA
ncbi:MAG TPA: DeoR/GlpR family DNA-binding transcription regulator [Intrasporangium sp.]|uniref:DeoR/GlpR family DNA-binding transcription regulator n=1 Tax=Intrasporangium sp. TaxID=1925024 RepID=UPI002D77FC4E|nr:DeoR/GlpR family DNA-binding transcription regulator [Intrasporangium sp.]HET7398095.1 DeoR/GlpR family DNA-binding transcription regulator [Intrasporangium sp.]